MQCQYEWIIVVLGGLLKMSFGNDLYNEFYSEIGTYLPSNKEEDLFRALERAFYNLSLLGRAECAVIHGTKHQVSFSETEGTFFCTSDSGKTVHCELADLLILSVNTKKMRICCLQNKYEKKRTGGMKIDDNLMADMRQFYLLKNRPEFVMTGRSRLLKDAICWSVGSYGVFYSDRSRYNMNYYSAAVLEAVTPSATGKKRRIYMPCTPLPPTKIVNRPAPHGPYQEMQYADSIIHFGNAIEDMLIGTPFSLKEGITILNDLRILETIGRVLNLNGNYLNEMRTAITDREPTISYRAAVVVKSNT